MKITPNLIRKGIKILAKNNNQHPSELVIPDYITPEMIEKGIKILENQLRKKNLI